MKNLSSKLLIVFALVFATVSFAAEPQNGYFTVKGATTLKANAKTLTFPPTDITVTNASMDYIHVIVDGTSIDDILRPTENDHIRNFGGAYSTSITLRDPNYRLIWSGVVCPRALVNVYGQPGNYHVNFDSEYCY